MPSGLQADLDFEAGLAPIPTSARLTAWQPEAWPVAAGWRPVIERFLASAPGRQLGAFLRERLAAGAIVYPPQPFRALQLTALTEVKVVILGQDPYHGPGQAEGLAFSVAPGVKLPPSLRNIFKELQRDLGLPLPASGSLVGWAQQGVLLLNTSLTVEQGLPASHARQGWELLTDALLAEVAAQTSPCVYLLWGSHAQAKAPLIEQTAQPHGREALLLQANHPSPLSALRPPAPFMGCAHFRQANEFLTRRGRAPIAW
ncbi:MAG: uracil-DNA glycosylase [Burkholderiaceae bacterium]